MLPIIHKTFKKQLLGKGAFATKIKNKSIVKQLEDEYNSTLEEE